MTNEEKMRDVLDRADDLLGYIFLLNRPLTENELKKVEALQIEIEWVLAQEKTVAIGMPGGWL